MTNTGAGTDTMTVTGIMGLGRGKWSTDYAMQATDEAGGEWVVTFSSGMAFDRGHVFGQAVGNALSEKNYREDFSGVTIDCIYHAAADAYTVDFGEYSLPLKAFDFHPVH